MSDTLTFRGEGKFEIRLQKPPIATAEGEIVVVTLPVFAGGFPNATAQIEMVLSLEDAEQLLAQLQHAVKMARAALR